MKACEGPCKVFVAGPRAILVLNADVRDRLDSVISQSYTFLVGDSNGVDKAVQRHLAEKQYKNVIVYFSGKMARNNLGNWTVKSVEVADGVKGFDFYAAKDMEMAKDADYGFMIWNGKSKGTLNDLINLIDLGKKSLLYFVPHKKFYQISEQSHVEKVLSVCEHDIQEMSKKLGKHETLQQIALF